MAKTFYDGPVISKLEAKSQGLKRYFTGKPCKRGHIDQRLISSNVCDQCHKEKVSTPGWKESWREYHSKWYSENKESVIKRTREYKKKNSNKVKAQSKALYESNKEQRIKQIQEWRDKNPEKIKIYTAKKNNNRRAASSGKISQERVAFLLEAQRGKCANCKEKLMGRYHVDHIRPLSRGGENADSNIEILCPSCNQRKHAKDPIDWARENGRLL